VALKSAGFSLAYVQSNVLSPSRMHVTAFSIDLQLIIKQLFQNLKLVQF